ncbi:MAG: shikimate kinase [Desulfobulbus propionicus]|nr:MAG: shikimate kinase [Desulfobulbus propionicus]
MALIIERIVLTGFRATGKSVTGRLLARQLDWQFQDTDDLLVSRFGCSVEEYVGKNGWEKFRQAEADVLQALRNSHRHVIATGGGAIQHTREWSGLRQGGLVIWLHAPVDVIKQRMASSLDSDKGRPSLTGGDPLDEVEEVLRGREPLYRAGADLEFDSSTLSPAELVSRVAGKIYLTETGLGKVRQLPPRPTEEPEIVAKGKNREDGLDRNQGI